MSGWPIPVIESPTYGRFETLWTDEEMISILRDAKRIDEDVTLRVNSDGTNVRPLGHWEEMRLDQRDMMRWELRVK